MGSARPAALALPVNSLAVRAPSIPHVLLQAAIRRLAAPELPVRGPVLGLAQDLERPVPASAHAPAQGKHHPLAKLRARSAPPRAAAVEGSSSTPRLKKAR
jgi:hypothetical protein